MKTVAVIIPTYRRPKLLERAIRSALQQTYPNVLVRVYDNASGDTTAQVVQNYVLDGRTTYHCHTENIGSLPNFQYGMRQVTEDFFVVLSDDDVLAPHFLLQTIYLFEKYPQAMFACVPTLAVDAQGRVLYPPVAVYDTECRGVNNAKDSVQKAVAGTIPTRWSGIVFRREVLDGLGPVNPAMGPFADAGYVMHAMARYPFVIAGGLGAVYTVHKHGVGASTQCLTSEWPQWWQTMAQAVEHDRQVLPSVREAYRDLMWPSFHKIGIRQALKALGLKDTAQARRVARGLDACGYPVTAGLVWLLALSVKSTPPLQWAFSLINTYRERRTDRRIAATHAKYGRLVHFMNML